MTSFLNSSTSCGVSPVTNVGAQCSGNGDCLALFGKGICACREHWKGESDFQVTNSLLDCQINVILIQVLWALYLAFHLGSFVRTFPKLKWLWNKHKSIVARSKAAGRKYTIWDNKGLLSLVPYYCLGYWCQIVYAITKLVNQDYKLGGSVHMSIMYILWRITFYFTADNFNPGLLASLLRSQRDCDHIISLNNRLSLAHFVLINLTSIAVIIPMVIADDPFFPVVGMVSAAVFFLTSSLAMLFFGVQCAYISRKVSHILEESYIISKDPKTKAVKDKIMNFEKTSSNQGFLQFVLYGLFGAFPYLWNKHDYMLPFAWFAATLTVMRCSNTLVHEEADKSQSGGRGSLSDMSADGKMELALGVTDSTT